jgi:hypothetical protein
MSCRLGMTKASFFLVIRTGFLEGWGIWSCLIGWREHLQGVAYLQVKVKFRTRTGGGCGLTEQSRCGVNFLRKSYGKSGRCRSFLLSDYKPCSLQSTQLS